MKHALPFLSVPLLASCVAGPNYHVPRTAVAERPDAAAPFLGQNGAVASQEEPPPNWWRLYGDPRLDSYVEEALAANTDLRAAEANLRRATAIVREAEASRTVRSSVSGQALGSRVAGPTGDLPAPLSYSLGFDLSYPLDLAGSIRRGIEASNAQAEATLAARDQVRVVVAAIVTRSYARVCAANDTLAAVRHVVEIQRSTLNVAIRLDRGGLGTQADVERSRAAAYASSAVIPEIVAERQAGLFELAALMGRVPSDYPREAETCSAIPSIDRPIPVGDGAALLRRRPDIRMAERLLASATAAIGIEEAELYPKVSIGGSVGTAGPTSRLLTPSTFGVSFGPLISWSFPNRKMVRARIAQAGADTDAAFANFDGSVLLALQQTETALSAYARARDRLKDLELAAEAAGKVSRDAKKLQRFGQSPLLDVLNAQASYADAQTSLAVARANLVDRQIDLFLALGGGWE
ncbi:efflux transporter outer membrane subunit [Novosphingobium sp. RL4]|uniref:efflux transporter outer membrane subunit n=1 Tax=Novosphingobium sp. RL4 TaxID=3109595 RepID=UPI002D785533|nr:efflux transporter outer membrane subunit [Novosphingobium sp. RL4]WRT91758.1 efflux transporter outer membrane subunit [Novosphingobium sp. RL4]